MICRGFQPRHGSLARIFQRTDANAARIHSSNSPTIWIIFPARRPTPRRHNFRIGSESSSSEVRDLLDQFHPGPLDLAAVPRQLRGHYVSDDGDYALYIYPTKDLWNDANLNEFASAVEAAVAKVPGAPHVTGIASNVYHTTGAIHAAFFQSTVYALVLIFLLVFLDFRRIVPTLAAISVLAMGLPMLIALMGLSNTSWNFANFFGLPILIGAGPRIWRVHGAPISGS